MQIIYPVRIIDESDVKNPVGLLKKKTLQIGIRESDITGFKEKSYIILDFGREMSGGIRILTFHAFGNAKIRLRFGESLSEVYAELGEKNATNDHSLRDFYVQLVNYSDMTFGQTGFRFLRIDCPDEDMKIEIKSVVCVSDADEREERGTFQCDDRLVNKIWDTAAYTLRLCMHNGYFWDGIKRDRLVWIGDLYPEMKAAHCLFENIPEIENCLSFAEAEAPVGTWMGNFPNYSLWWLIILADEYRHSGNKENLYKHFPYAKALLQHIFASVTKEGDTTFYPDFIDWPTYFEEGGEIEKKEASHTGTFYLLLLTLKKLKATFGELGENTALIDELLIRLSRRRVKPVAKYKQIVALGVLAGNKAKKNYENLCKNGAEGLSTFMAYEILSAVAACGGHRKALSMLKDYYGGMIKLGATTFWEDFDLKWTKNACGLDRLPKEGQKDIHGDFGRFCYVGFRHSLCHGWAAGVIPYIVENIAGIKESGIGCKSFIIEPHLSDIKNIKVVYPTPYGPLTVEHMAEENGKVHTDIMAPKEVKTVIASSHM